MGVYEHTIRLLQALCKYLVLIINTQPSRPFLGVVVEAESVKSAPVIAVTHKTVRSSASNYRGSDQRTSRAELVARRNRPRHVFQGSFYIKGTSSHGRTIRRGPNSTQIE